MYELRIRFYTYYRQYQWSDKIYGGNPCGEVHFRTFDTPELARDFLKYISQFNKDHGAILYNIDTKESLNIDKDGKLTKLNSENFI